MNHLCILCLVILLDLGQSLLELFNVYLYFSKDILCGDVYTRTLAYKMSNFYGSPTFIILLVYNCMPGWILQYWKYIFK